MKKIKNKNKIFNPIKKNEIKNKKQKNNIKGKQNWNILNSVLFFVIKTVKFYKH